MVHFPPGLGTCPPPGGRGGLLPARPLRDLRKPLAFCAFSGAPPFGGRPDCARRRPCGTSAMCLSACLLLCGRLAVTRASPRSHRLICRRPRVFRRALRIPVSAMCARYSRLRASRRRSRSPARPRTAFSTPAWVARSASAAPPSHTDRRAGSSADARPAPPVLQNVLEGKDDRLVVIVGPCSIHDVQAAKEYGADQPPPSVKRADMQGESPAFWAGAGGPSGPGGVSLPTRAPGLCRDCPPAR